MDRTCTGSALDDRSYSPRTAKWRPALQQREHGWVEQQERGLQGKKVEQVKGTEQVRWKHSHNVAVGSSDHPVGVDEGTTAEVEAAAVLE